MILWFLRLFSQFRALERAIDSWKIEESDWKITESELTATADMWRTRCEAAESRVRELTDKLLEDRGRVADAMSIRVIGKRVFSKADISEIPVVSQKPIAPARIMGRQAVNEDTRRFFEEALAPQKDAPPVA